MLPDDTAGIRIPSSWGHLIVAVLFLGAFGFIVWESLSFPRLARIFPLLMGTAGVIIGALQVCGEYRGIRRAKAEGSFRARPANQEKSVWSPLGPIAWLASYFVAIATLGFMIGSGLYVFIALFANAKLPPFKAIAGALAIAAFVFILTHFLKLDLPVGVFGL